MNEPNAVLYIDPPSHHFLGDKLFQVDDRPNGDRLLEPWAHMRRVLEANGIPVHTADFMQTTSESGAPVSIYMSAGMLDRYPSLASRPDVVLSAFFVFECPIVEPSLYRALGDVERRFKHVFTWSDSASLERFTGRRLRFDRFYWPQSFDDVHPGIWDNTDRKFLVMINSNKLPRVYWRELYTRRLEAVEFFSRFDEVDLYGPGWEKASFRVGKTLMPFTLRRLQHSMLTQWQRVSPDARLVAARRAWRGVARSKSATLGGYDFAVCFENMTLNGWITEKIFDCFFAGTVPVYWGAPEIGEVIPEACFIDMRQFEGFQDLRHFLKSLTPADLRRYRRCARDFLRSKAFQPFSKQAFAERFLELVQEASPVPLAAGERT